MAQFPFGISSDHETEGYYAWLQVAHNPDGTLRSGGGGGSGGGTVVATFSRIGTLSVVTGTGRYLVTADATVVGVVAAINTAPTGSSIICDVNKNGVTLFTTQAERPVIPSGGYQTLSQAVPDVTSLSSGDYLSVDIDQVGSSIAGSDLTVEVIYTFD